MIANAPPKNNLQGICSTLQLYIKNEDIYLAHEKEELYANVKIKLSIYE